MNLNNNQITELTAAVNAALFRLYQRDMSLIDREVNERSVAFRFGLYFTETIRETSFYTDNDLTIDFDYNRNIGEVKRMEGFSRTHGVYPDIILHHRGFNDKNILVIEFKGFWNNNNGERHRDFRKLVEFTHPQRNDYQYGLGVFVDLGPTFDTCQFTYFNNGIHYDQLEKI